MPARRDPRRDRGALAAARELPPSRQGEVASRWGYRDGAGEIGVIRSVTAPFCNGCTRARLSADGQALHVPVREHGSDLRALLRGGAGDEELEARLGAIWTGRGDRYSELRAEAGAALVDAADAGAPGGELPRQPARPRPKRRPRIEMSYIGG